MTSLGSVRQALQALILPGTVAELRILGTHRGTISGYFNDLDELAGAAEKWSGAAEGVYFTLNPVNPDLLARACNRVVEYAKHATGDTDVTQRHWLLIDFDPRRASGISSTDAEHEAALQRARDCRDWLCGVGIPGGALLMADSGNGAHLVLRIDLPNDEASTALLRRCLAGLAFAFDDDRVIVDQTTFNAARLSKVYGTIACKGESLPDRPHRASRLLDFPAALAAVPAAVLRGLAEKAPRPATAPRDRRLQDFDLEKWISDHGLPVAATGTWNGGRKWILNPCPWNPEHANRAAYIVQFASGAVAAGCHHNGCADKDWHALRDAYEPGWREGRDAGGPNPDSRPLKGSGTGNGAVLRVWELPEPGLRPQAIGGLIPTGVVTIVYGDGGQGKSYLVLYVLTCIAAGLPCLGFPMEQAPTLYLDAELDADEFVRRAYRVARGLGLSRPPDGLHYWRLTGSLMDARVQQQAAEAIGGCHAEVIALDSLTIAAYGGDLTQPPDTTTLLKILESWGTTALVVDHMPKPAPGVSQSEYRPFGSVFKFNIGRSVIQLHKAPGGGLVLRQTKNNFGPKVAPIGIGIAFGEAVTITVLDLADDQLSGIDEHLPALERVARGLARHAEGVSADSLAQELENISPKTVQNHFTTLKAQGRAERLGDGRWRLVSNRFPIPDPFRERESGTAGEGDGRNPFRTTAPDLPCPVCHSTDWHRAGGGWTCCICHPPVAGRAGSGQ